MINPELCMARTWGNSWGCQCSKPPAAGSEYCVQHRTELEKGELTHGRMGGPIPPNKEDEMQKAQSKEQKEQRALTPFSLGSIRVSNRTFPVTLGTARFSWLGQPSRNCLLGHPGQYYKGVRGVEQDGTSQELVEGSFVHVRTGGKDDIARRLGMKHRFGEVCALFENEKGEKNVLMRRFELPEYLEQQKGLDKSHAPHPKEVIETYQVECVPLLAVNISLQLKIISKDEYLQQEEALERNQFVWYSRCVFCPEGSGMLWDVDASAGGRQERRDLALGRTTPQQESSSSTAAKAPGRGRPSAKAKAKATISKSLSSYKY